MPLMLTIRIRFTDNLYITVRALVTKLILAV